MEEDVDREKYGAMKVVDPKILLKNKGASVTGRKKELVDRLIAYDRNNNFNYEPVDESEDPVISTPAESLYKDVNTDKIVPKVTEACIQEYFEQYDKKFDAGLKMYKNKFLTVLRYCQQGDTFYAKGICRAEMKAHILYEVNISFFMHGEIIASSCDCTAGHSLFAHCKHVEVVLFAMKDVAEGQLQHVCEKFHHPKKKYTGSPITAKQFKKVNTNVLKSNLNKKESNSSDDEDETSQYRDFFRNLVVSRGMNNNMSMKMLLEPANPYAVVQDHMYSKYDWKYELQKDLLLIDITDADVQKVEEETRMQHKSSAWHKYRKHRITASKFYDCCRDLDEENSEKLASSIVYPEKFVSKATTHGKVEESNAINLFERTMLNNGSVPCEECGLIIMKKYPFIGATPDRLLAKETVVEVKCPYSAKYLYVNEETCPYLCRNEDGTFSLKKEHPYYFQIQGQLMVTGRLYCDFLVYTYKSLVRIPIGRDEQFMNNMLPKLITFYDTYLLPAIYNKYIYRDYHKYFGIKKQD